MLQDILDSLSRWNSATNERQKLQHSYLAVIIMVIIIAGLVSLVSASQGHQLAKVALFAIFAFIANGVVWNLLNSIILAKLPKVPKSSTKQASSKK